MDCRENIALSGSSSYYLHTGVDVSNPKISVQSSAGNSSPNTSPYGPNEVVPGGKPGKRKRGRPRKYGPGGRTPMSLGLSPVASNPPGTDLTTSTAKRVKGRPRGSGWKQQLAPLGEWMNSSAGLAFIPHIIHIASGEDISSKLLLFSQQRQRAVCILSANGVISAVTLRQPAASGSTVTYEGRFQILCLSGSYLVAESGGPHNRTGGLSVSLCSPDGHVIGGGADMLIAGSTVQVMFFSFIYGGSKPKNRREVALDSEGEKNSELVAIEKSGKAASAASTLNLTPSSLASVWPDPSPDLRNLEREIDLMHG